MIKGGGTIHNQINEAYAGSGSLGGGKMGSQNIKNGSFYQPKYGSNNPSGNPGNMNQSPSPSQTFFKENPPMMMMDTTKKPGNIAMMNQGGGAGKYMPKDIGKQNMNLYPNKNPKKLYVSPYSQKIK